MRQEQRLELGLRFGVLKLRQDENINNYQLGKVEAITRFFHTLRFSSKKRH